MAPAAVKVVLFGSECILISLLLGVFAKEKFIAAVVKGRERLVRK